MTQCLLILAIFAALFLLGMIVRHRLRHHPAGNGPTIEQRVERLEKQYDIISPALVPISVAFQTVLRTELTHFHTPEMDALMVKLGPPYSMTDAEFDRLIEMLAERARDMGHLISEQERGDAAAMLPLVIRRVKAETASAGAEPLVRIIVALDPNSLR